MRRLLFLALPAWLGSCAWLVGGPTALHFKPAPAGAPTEAATLLERGAVPANQLTSVPDALSRAPAGSLIVACWQTAQLRNFWGPCSHVARKLSGEQIADQPGGLSRASVRSTHTLYSRYAVIVLDVGVRPAQMPALEQEVQRLNGQPYNLSGAVGTTYCSNYQNDLQRAAGLGDVIALNPRWNLLLPADALQMPGARVLWVGVQHQAKLPNP